MGRASSSLLMFLLLAGGFSRSHISAETPKSVDKILSFLEEVSDKFVLGDSKDIVLVLGNTGSGKSTLTLLITDIELEGQKANSDDDDEDADYIVVDKHQLISNETTTVSQTLIPNLLIDSSHTTFYDCAGFDDSRGVAHDIAVTYLIRKLLNYANNVKFVFTIPQWSVKTGGERLEFKKLLKHATNLILNIEQYKDSIALVVTKSDKPANRNEANDEPKIKKVAGFLEQVKSDLEDSENPKIKEQKLMFIDALLKKSEDGRFARIRMHRMVNEKGPLKNMPVQEQEKKAIKKMIYESIQYQTVESEDFGYAISSDSALKVVDLLDELEQQLHNDVSDIGNEFKKLYWQEEKENTDINVVYDKIHQVNEQFSSKLGKTYKDLGAFRSGIEKVIESLKLKESLRSQMKRLDRHLEFVSFLTAVGNRNLSNSFRISDGLLDTKQYFSDSEKWYGFLKNMHQEISEYKHQTKLKTYDAYSMLSQVKQAIEFLGENSEMEFHKTGIDTFLNHFELLVDKLQVESVNVNSYKLRAFGALLTQLTMADEVICSGSKLTVRGYNVKFGDYFTNLAAVCDTKVVEIFALNKVFFDTIVEKQDEQVQIVVLAPTWEVIGSGIKLDLSGSPAKNYDTSAKSGYEGVDGEAGKPGKPGGPSGHFFGIADKFINDISLKILTDGGKGGDGQNAGKGSTGMNGTSPPCTNSDFNCNEVWDRENFKYTRDGTQSGRIATWKYDVSGKKARKSSNGGDGGCGGLGGSPGNLLVIGLNRSPNMTLSNSTGASGADGKGEPGGETVIDGDDIHVEVRYLIEVSGFMRKLPPVMISTTQGERYETTNGKDGANCQFRDNPVKQTPQRRPTESINSFKSFVREYLKDNVRENELRQFLGGLETNSNVDSLYDILAFVDDLQTLQEQFFKMRNTLEFRPFFKSMLARIVVKDQTIAPNDEIKKALSYLYAATLSKITSNGAAAGQQTILNLNSYLEEIETQLKDLDVIERDVQITSYRDQYNNSLYAKIDAADELIKNKILPEIDMTLDNTKLQIHKLINETIDKQNKTEEAIKKQKEQEIALGKSMMLSSIFSMLKVTGACLAFAGPVGAGIGAVMGAGALIGEAVTGKSAELKGTSLRLTWSVNKIGEEIKYNNDLFKQQMDDVARELDSYQEYKEDFKNIRNEIEEMREKIKVAMASEDEDEITLARDMRVRLDELVEQEKDKVKKLKPLADKVSADKMRILSYVQTTVSIVGLSVDVYNSIKADKAKMESIRAAIQQLEVELQGWKVYEQQIYSIMVPMFQLMQNSLKSTIRSLEGQSHVQLDIRKWEVRSKLRDVKFTFDQMTETSKLKKDFAHHFEKVEAAMDVLIDVYDRIESLVENAQFATFISQISQNGPPLVNDLELEGAIKRLDAIIQTNIILDRHALVVNAFKQHYFPFAPLYFAKFELPTILQLDDTDSLKRRAIAQIKDLKTGVIFSQITIENRDKYLYSDVNFDSEDYGVALKNAPPFYTWKSSDVFNQTKKLLQGQEIFLFVDITKAPINDYAIKYHEFILRLKLVNKNLQREFDNDLKDYHVTMKMIGNSFYRCAQRIYSIPTDSNLVLDYSMKYGADGKPTNPNDVYKKIRGNSNFLSPYGLWSVQLTKNDRRAPNLSKFEDELIDVEFAGKGEYLQNVPAVTSETCTDDLDKYYFLDSIFDFQNKFYSPILMKTKIFEFS